MKINNLNFLSNKNKICGIYCITLISKDKKYIGSSINIKKRLMEHKSLLFNNKHHSKKLQNAFNKYGVERFAFEILEECNKKEILERE